MPLGPELVKRELEPIIQVIEQLTSNDPEVDATYNALIACLDTQMSKLHSRAQIIKLLTAGNLHYTIQLAVAKILADDKPSEIVIG